MSTWAKGFVVTMEQDISEDRAKEIISAFKLIGGVLDVRPVESNYDDQINREIIRHELVSRIYALLGR